MLELVVAQDLAIVEQDLALVVDQLAAGRLAAEDALDLAEERVAEDLHFLLANALQLQLLGVFDRLGALVLVGTFAREDASVDHDAADARRNLERAVAHVAGLFAEDRPQQLLFRRQLALALRRDFADQDVARLHLGADAHDARIVEVLERLFTDVRDILGDFLFAELGVAGDALEFLDVDRGVHIVFGDALGYQDRVFEVVTLPGHERDDHVLTERELTHVAGRTVGEHIALLDGFTAADDRLLVVASALVG